jgi:class 3 adenylate cyclase
LLIPNSALAAGSGYGITASDGRLPEGTVTLLFTDIEGSALRLRTLGDRYGEALSTHRAVLRGAFEAAGGREIDTQGDSFFIAFAWVRDALEAAVAALRALAGEAARSFLQPTFCLTMRLDANANRPRLPPK